MAVFYGSFLSAELGRQNPVTVILPHDTRPAPPSGYPVLYFLHGKGDDNNTPLLRSGLEKYANERGLCVVLPDMGLSYCSDLVCGGNYYSYLTHELPELICNIFKISLRREDTFIGGVSMGGYGAIKCVLKKPERYGGCVALSPTADVLMEMNSDCQSGRSAAWKAIVGERLPVNYDIDLYHILDDVDPMMSVTPKIYFACGRKDEMYNSNIKLKDALDRKRIDYTFEQADADHEWSFWDVAMQRGFDAIIGKKLPEYTPQTAAEQTQQYGGYQADSTQGYPAYSAAQTSYGSGYPASGASQTGYGSGYPASGAAQSEYGSGYPSSTANQGYAQQDYSAQNKSYDAQPAQAQPSYYSQSSQQSYTPGTDYTAQSTEPTPQPDYSAPAPAATPYTPPEQPAQSPSAADNEGHGLKNFLRKNVSPRKPRNYPSGDDF